VDHIKVSDNNHQCFQSEYKTNTCARSWNSPGQRLKSVPGEVITWDDWDGAELLWRHDGGRVWATDCRVFWVASCSPSIDRANHAVRVRDVERRVF
jgi:hypothetical protein